MPHPIARRIASSLTAAVLLVTGVLAAAPQPVAARDGSTFVGLVNQRRAEHGVGAVALHGVLDRIAVERADQMAANNDMQHDMDYVKHRLAQEGVCWERLGEIIAYNSVSSVGERIDRFVHQWYTSTTGHRELMLHPAYTHAGGSWTTGSDGQHYAAMVFVKLCGATSPGGTFTDTGSSQFRADIAWLVAEGVTAGCSADRFCPRSAVTREQMASFLRRITGVPASTSGWFTDIRTSMHRADINGVAKADIAAGCDDVRYCPSTRVTREQMASFLVRSLDLPATTRDYFRDDDGSMHEPAINMLAAAGITGGCSSGRFCPGDPVTREQMAGFLHRAFGD